MALNPVLADAIKAHAGVAKESLSPGDEIASALRAVRAHLGMEIGFISEFLGSERVFQYVDSDLSKSPIHRGDRLSMDAGYCRKVVSGELPQLIPDTSLVQA